MEENQNQEIENEITPEAVEQEVVAPTEETVPVVENSIPEPESVAVEENTEESAPVAEPVVVDNTPHDQFDWSISKRNHVEYSEAETKRYIDDYERTLTLINDNEIVKGMVKSIRSGDVVLDINYKSDGIVSLSEFRDIPDLTLGDIVEVYVETQEDERGQLILSRKKAKLLLAWETIVDAFETGKIIKGTVISKTKGGLIVDAYGLETFLPGSQIDIKPIIDYDSYVGKTMEFKVVKINEVIKNAVVSHKALVESDLADQREQIIGGLEKGQVLEGIVKNITDFGAFMDLGGVDGLLYITDISWGRINHPEEVLTLNEKINVVVIDFDENKKRISLGLKQLTPHPWEMVGDDITEGSVVKGKIVNIEDYGAFLEVKPGVEGLIHVSEVSWSNQPVAARDFFKLDQEYEAKVVMLDKDERKMSLSLKQLETDPWNDIDVKYPVGSRHTGIVKNLTPYGVFVEIANGIGGMVHVSDLSWTKRFSHPSEFTKVGDEIEVMIMEIDKENRKLSLGHKQVEENPWDAFESVFPVGSYHEATIVRKEEKGATVQLPYGLEAFAPIKHIKKEDGTTANVDDVITVKVIEFNRDDKRIIVSHQRYLEDIKKEADAMIKRERDKSETEGRSAVQRENSKLERTTLGDIDALAQLKEQLSTDTPEKAKAKKAATKKEEANTDVETAETAETTEEKPKAVKKTTKKASKTSDDADASSDTNATSEVSNTEHTEEESSDN
jgi:small subunit ribosomal protein S1